MGCTKSCPSFFSFCIRIRITVSWLSISFGFYVLDYVCLLIHGDVIASIFQGLTFIWTWKERDTSPIEGVEMVWSWMKEPWNFNSFASGAFWREDLFWGWLIRLVGLIARKSHFCMVVFGWSGCSFFFFSCNFILIPYFHDFNSCSIFQWQV